MVYYTLGVSTPTGEKHVEVLPCLINQALYWLINVPGITQAGGGARL